MCYTDDRNVEYVADVEITYECLELSRGLDVSDSVSPKQEIYCPLPFDISLCRKPASGGGSPRN
jgi:hypothetical protein